MADFRLPLDYKKNVKYSNFDLSKDIRTSIKSCAHIPIYRKVLMPGDKFDASLASKIMSEALVTPLLGDYTMRFAWFKSSLANYYGWLDNNTKSDSLTLLSRAKHRISAFPVGVVNIDTTEVQGGVNSFLKTLFSTPYTIVDDSGSQPIDASLPYRSILPIVNDTIVENIENYQIVDKDRFYQLNFGVRKSSLLNYLGFPAGYTDPYKLPFTYDEQPPQDYGFDKSNTHGRSFDASSILVYLDIVRNYLIHNQARFIPYTVVANDDMARDSEFPGARYQFGRYLLAEDLDMFFRNLRLEKDGVDLAEWLLYKFNTRTWDLDYLIKPADDITGTTQSKHFGALRILYWLTCIKDYGLFNAMSAPDMMQNLLNRLNTTSVNVKVSEDGYMSINNLRFQNKMQRLVERYDISDGRASSWLRSVWGQDSPRNLDIPDYVHSVSFDVRSDTVVSTANTVQASGGQIDSGSPAGEMSGLINQFTSSKTHEDKSFDFYVNNEDNVDSVIMCICTLVPQVDYGEGIDDELASTMFADDYKPELDNLGFQDVSLLRYNALTGLNSDTTTLRRVVGKEVAWTSLMTDVNRVSGELGPNGFNQTWVLLRRYRKYDDNFYYLFPADYQYMFAYSDVGADNFTLQVGFKIRMVRPKGQSYMPTLE